ncbi:MAG: SCO family protein [Methylophilaceae bacterium]|jgi:protein SCO1|nr:SCO family protein [Methylophilaceae bacterium]MDG1454040.1 SCO family protein [Methylophilaceae bacterium]
MFYPVFKFGRQFLLILTLCLLASCGDSQPSKSFVGTDITGADFSKSLALTDHTGTPRTLDDYKGKVIVMFFGFTHCPDVCPTTMLDLKNTMKLLGDKADEVQVLFVTVDPERDTQEVLAKFVPSFDSRFIGLRGDAEQTAETVKNFKIYYAKVPGKSENDYSIDHSAGMYAFDKKGKVRLYLGYGQKPEDIASDVQNLL